MIIEEAKNKLIIHGSVLANSEDWSKHFLGLLKPYRKRIDNAVFEDIIACLKATYEQFERDSKIDLEIVAGVHCILHFGKEWVLDENSGLRKSGRLPELEILRIENWLRLISDIYADMVWWKIPKDYLFGEKLDEKKKYYKVDK